MVNQITIVAVGLLQVFGISFFASQPKDQCSPAPAIGSKIFLLSVLMLFWDSEMIPKRFKKYSPKLFEVGDLLFTILFTELFVVLGWCEFERITFRSVGLICRGKFWCEYAMMTICSILAATASLCIVIEIVCPDKMKNSMGEVLGNLPVPKGTGPMFEYLQDMRTYVLCAMYFCQLTREQRLLSVRAFQMQVLRSKIPLQKDPGELDVLNVGSQVEEEKPDNENKPTEPELQQELSP
ncbi:uncharacterized protein LOC108093456 [Drosophila ficusphila]|uniref:uncharacterized protein LOC108093456 n=1 Tax=Drosophila ficusphila TaxID=30025 RepID=UPI0007E87E98|nr:uncharacterized protein LOC108093456 [Drosophila ficusphila]